MIVFFEKPMITGLPLQNKLRTYKKRRRKKQRQNFFLVSRALTPPPQPEDNFMDPRMDIRYRGGRETMSRIKTFYSAAMI